MVVVGAVDYVKQSQAVKVSDTSIRNAAERIAAPFKRTGGENPYTLHQELQEITHNLVGIIRTKAELADAINKIAEIRKRIENVSVQGDRVFNPGFHLSFDLDNMLLVAESTAKSAIVREESRGGHTRDDFPVMNTKWLRYQYQITFSTADIQEYIPRHIFLTSSYLGEKFLSNALTTSS